MYKWIELAEIRDGLVVTARLLGVSDFAVDAEERNRRGRQRRLNDVVSLLGKATQALTEIVEHVASEEEAAEAEAKKPKLKEVIIEAKKRSKGKSNRVKVKGYTRNGIPVSGYERRNT